MKIFLNGANGKMGKEIKSLCEKSGDETVIEAGSCFDYDAIGESVKPDVIIDFSSPTALDGLINYATDKKIPLLIGTTGYTETQREKIKKASFCVPIFFSANFSLGVFVLIDAVKAALKVFPDAKVTIFEVHHEKKADRPSGTALMIAEKIGKKYAFKSTSGEQVEICSMRYGKVFGIHEVIVCSGDQTLNFRHEVSNRRVFAEGAIRAAKFIVGKRCGLYDMTDIIDET